MYLLFKSLVSAHFLCPGLQSTILKQKSDCPHPPAFNLLVTPFPTGKSLREVVKYPGFTP